jgi:hypothetical protein
MGVVTKNDPNFGSNAKMKRNVHCKESCKKKDSQAWRQFLCFFKMEAKNHSENVPELGQPAST